MNDIQAKKYKKFFIFTQILVKICENEFRTWVTFLAL